MKIIRHRVGNKQSSVRPAKSFVCITDLNWCEKMYFQFFRGYTINIRGICVKEIISEEEDQRRKLFGIQ